MIAAKTRGIVCKNAVNFSGIREVEHQLFTREGIGLGATEIVTGQRAGPARRLRVGQQAELQRRLVEAQQSMERGYWRVRQAEAALASCRESANGDGVTELRVFPGERIEASTRMPDAYRTCLDAALAEARQLTGRDDGGAHLKTHEEEEK